MARVLLLKKTGDLFEAHPIHILDDSKTPDLAPFEWRISLVSMDGWIIRHPRTGTFFYFINRESEEKLFEELGEL